MEQSIASPSTSTKQDIAIYPYDWTERDNGDYYEIFVWGLLKDNVPGVFRIKYLPQLIIVLPSEYNWDGTTVTRAVNAINKILKADKCVEYEYKKMHPLYSAYTSMSDCIVLKFRTWNAMNHCANLLNKPIKLWKECEPFKIDVCENKITTITKLLVERNITYSAWLSGIGELVPLQDKATKHDGEYIVDFRTLQLVPETEYKHWKVRKSILVWDIECNAENINAMPKPFNPEDVCFNIGVLYRDRAGKITEYLLHYLPTTSVEGCVMLKYESEVEMILGWCDLVNKLRPDGHLTHNGMGFDMGYLDVRLSVEMVKWPNISAMLKYDVTIKDMEWESSAYAHMKMQWLDTPGLVPYDLLPIVKRTQQRQNSYKLDELGKKFLGHGKFSGNESLIKVDLDEEDEDEVEEDYMEVHKIFEFFRSGDPDKLKNIGVYCIGDVRVTLGVYDHIEADVTLDQLSSVTFVTSFMIFTRGQQIRTLNQIYNTCHAEDKDGRSLNIYIIREAYRDLVYNGGHVFEPKKGLWYKVKILDFAGLYPSIIVAHNICYSTWVTDPTIPDEKCWIHVIPYDKKDAKGEPLRDADGNILRGEYRHRYLKSPKGVLPLLLEKLTASRGEDKDEMKAMTKRGEDKTNAGRYLMLSMREQAKKISANSVYGGLGTKFGKLPFMEGAILVTFLARTSISLVAETLEKKHNATIVYGDTDSVMVTQPDDNNEPNQHGRAKLLADDCTTLFPPPMRIEVDKVFEVFLLLEKKQYIGFIRTDKGIVLDNLKDMTARGVMIVRRDNCLHNQLLYKELVFNILKGGNKEEMVNMVCTKHIGLLSRAVKEADLLFTQKLGEKYKLENNPLNLYSKHLVQEGKVVQAGDRLTYVFVERTNSKDQGKELQGKKMELPELRHKYKLKLDYRFYLEKKGIKPFDKVFSVVYPDVVDNPPIKYLYKLIKAKQKICTTIQQEYVKALELHGPAKEKPKVISRHRQVLLWYIGRERMDEVEALWRTNTKKELVCVLLGAPQTYTFTHISRYFELVWGERRRYCNRAIKRSITRRTKTTKRK